MLEPREIERYQRELRAMLIRASDEDPEGFAAIVDLLTQSVAAIPLAVQGLKIRLYPWRSIAAALGDWTSSTHRKYAKAWAEEEARKRLVADAIRDHIRSNRL